jgi:hypothetical protein
MPVLEEGFLIHFWQVGFSAGIADVVAAVVVVVVVVVVVCVGVLG